MRRFCEVWPGDWKSNAGSEWTRRWPAGLGDAVSHVRDVCMSCLAFMRTCGVPVSPCGESGSLSLSRGDVLQIPEPYSHRVQGSLMPCSLDCSNVRVSLRGISSWPLHRSSTYTSAIVRASSSSIPLTRMSQLVQCQTIASLGWCWRWTGGGKDSKNWKR